MKAKNWNRLIRIRRSELRDRLIAERLENIRKEGELNRESPDYDSPTPVRKEN